MSQKIISSIDQHYNKLTANILISRSYLNKRASHRLPKANEAEKKTCYEDAVTVERTNPKLGIS